MSAKTDPRVTLTKWRRAKKMTQASLGEALDCDASQIGRIEGGSRQPGRRLALAIEKLVGISPDTWDAA